MTTASFESLDSLFPSMSNQVQRDANLSNANLQGADLRFTNLHGITLAGANLQGANLNGANLQGADLTRTNFDNATLRGADLSGAQIAMGSFVCADLSGAILVQSSLDAATLTQACLQGADLRGAYLVGVDFSGSKLHRSYYSASTYFEKGFDPNQASMLTEVQLTFGQVLKQFNLLGQAAQSYLGNIITARYWEVARPDALVLQQFQVQPDSGQLLFLGNKQTYLGFSELQLSQIWVNSFIQQCSHVIRYFPNLLDQDHVNYTLSTL